MTKAHAIIEEEAIGWIIRMRDPAFDAWGDFTDWLETDPVHARIYDEMAVAEADAVDVLQTPQGSTVAANDDEPGAVRFSRRAFAGWAVAASLVAVIGYGSLRSPDTTYEVATEPGARETVRLADGSRLDLNGDTKIVLDRSNPRFARLESGEVLFTIRHDPQRPFAVEVGGTRLVDAGTAFNVTRAGGSTDVAVSEGLVIFDPDGRNVSLAPGKALSVDDATDRPVVRNVDPGSVASWKSGRLVYQGTPLGVVARDLSRSLGVNVAVEGNAAAREFSGTLKLSGDEGAVGRVAPVMGLAARRTDRGWVLSERADATR